VIENRKKMRAQRGKKIKKRNACVRKLALKNHGKAHVYRPIDGKPYNSNGDDRRNKKKIVNMQF